MLCAMTSSWLSVGLIFCVTALSLGRQAAGVESKCSACVVVAKELLEILAEEQPRNHLDMRNRLNSKGVREGKIIDYRVSELRAVEILDGLCARVENYALETVDGRRAWRKPREGVYKFNQAKLIQEEQGKEIKRWCHRVVEEKEEELESLLRSGDLSVKADVPSLLCANVTASCKPSALERELLGDSQESAAAAAQAAAAAAPASDSRSQEPKDSSTPEQTGPADEL